jgi:predicted HD phosphohydrolase
MIWFLTYTGKKFFPFQPNVADICLEDIAHSLSRICRFNGHTQEFYSVAQHSAEMAQMAVRDGEPVEVARWCLLHDAAEAYLADLYRPIKANIAWTVPNGKQAEYGDWSSAFVPFENVESRLLYAIARRFDLLLPIPAKVAEYDERMLATERRDLLRPGGPAWENFTAQPYPPPFRLYPVNPYAAEGFFLSMFQTLFGGQT